MPKIENQKHLFDLTTVPTASRSEIRQQVAYANVAKMGEIVGRVNIELVRVDERPIETEPPSEEGTL